MVDSLNSTPGGLPLSDEAFIVLQREAGIRLAGAALTAAGGDWDEARAMLRDWIEAIGARSYETAAGNYHFGQAT